VTPCRRSGFCGIGSPHPERKSTVPGTNLRIPPGLLEAAALVIGVWLLGGLFRRRRLPRLVGGLVASWAIWRLRQGPPTRSLRTLLPLLILGWLALRLTTGAPPDRQDPGRGDPI
jgi:hypothetical protein